jgi:hypothetical protein
MFERETFPAVVGLRTGASPALVGTIDESVQPKG